MKIRHQHLIVVLTFGSFLFSGTGVAESQADRQNNNDPEQNWGIDKAELIEYLPATSAGRSSVEKSKILKHKKPISEAIDDSAKHYSFYWKNGSDYKDYVFGSND